LSWLLLLITKINNLKFIILASSSDSSDIDGGEGGDRISPPTKRQRTTTNNLNNNSNCTITYSNHTQSNINNINHKEKSMQSDQSDSNHLFMNGSTMATNSSQHSVNGKIDSSKLLSKNGLSIHMNNDHNNQNSTNNSSNNNNNNNNVNDNSNGNTSSLNSFNGNSTNSNNNLNNENYHENNGNHQINMISSHQFNFSNSQKDVLRLIGQHLRYLGLNKTTEMLIKESGCMLEHPIAADFCHLIMSGNWDQAEMALNSLKAIMNDENSLNDIVNMRFLILEQKYLECLEDGKIFEALKCLRDELAPLKFNTDRLHELSRFV
jgi:hypothetical protein